jgi:sensor histidine kinase YesM
MTLHDLIFSEQRNRKIWRHVIFWSCWFLYLSCTQLRNQTPDDIGMNHFIIYQMSVSANRVVLQMLFCYPFVYFVIPRYFKARKFKKFFLLLCLMSFSIYWITYLDYYYIWSDTQSPLFFNIPKVIPLSAFQCEYFSLYSNLHCTGTLVAVTFLLSVKYYKNWFNKERENEQLISQNSQAELQLLKAQVHPHFLFNTLNNIYSLMLDDSPRAITVLNELSGMILYMTNECTDSLVPVKKEIKMLLDYIGLEKIRYGDRLEMIIDIRQDHPDSLLIAPLLLIPFVENSFKHGASKTVEHARIHLIISIEREWLEFRISNPVCQIPETETRRVKIGLQNVKKRLQILYPDKHLLNFETSNEIFEVTMKIFLGKNNPVYTTEPIRQISNIPAYAQ